MNKNKVKKVMLNEMNRVNEEAKNIEVGSQEYLNAAKAQREYAEGIAKLKWDLDPNTILSVGTTLSMLYVTMIYSETRILDTRLANTIKTWFLRIK